MEHFFELPVQYRNEGRKFQGRLVTFAYDYKCYVVVDGKEIVFQKDNDMTYKIIRETAEAVADPELLHSLVIAMNQLDKIQGPILPVLSADAA